VGRHGPPMGSVRDWRASGARRCTGRFGFASDGPIATMVLPLFGALLFVAAGFCRQSRRLAKKKSFNHAVFLAAVSTPGASVWPSAPSGFRRDQQLSPY